MPLSPGDKRATKESGIPFDTEDAVYFLGRESFVATKAGRMGPTEESFFAFLQRNTTSADRFFGLPHQRVVEIGTQIDL